MFDTISVMGNYAPFINDLMHRINQVEEQVQTPIVSETKFDDIDILLDYSRNPLLNMCKIGIE